MVVINTAGKLTEGEAKDGEFQAKFVQDPGMRVAEVINYIAFFWFIQFIFGCQHFVIAGTICKWYFTRDKSKLNSPIKTTFSHLLNFHLGSVCLGSMLITLVKILKMIVNAFQRRLKESRSPVAQFVACFLGWLIDQLEQILKYLVRNAYIIVAKDGTPFIESAKRAFGLLFQHIMDVIALNNFGDIVLAVGRLFITAIAGLVGYALMSQTNMRAFFIPLTIGIIFAFLIAHCFLSVFEMTVDTIFICFCIDCEENDGITRPYYMSEGLKKVMCEMKEVAGGGFTFGPEGQFLRQQQPGTIEGNFNNPEGGYPMSQPNQPPVYSIYPSVNTMGADNGNNPYPPYATPMQQNYSPYPSNPSPYPPQQNYPPYSSGAPYPPPPSTNYPQAPYGTAPPPNF
jgi:uncharacterized membrane protein YeaQ/YmgE (transglycosylase-associated protein family)